MSEGVHNPLDPTEILADLASLLSDTAVLFHHFHSRTRVYPQDVEAVITLTSAAEADTFGAWTQVVPINIIDFLYMATGFVIEEITAATTYFIQLGYSLTDGDDPTTAQIIGERRIRLATQPIARATEELELLAAHCPANAKLWGRIKTSSGDADGAKISVVIIRHTEITEHVPHLLTWPWGY